ncbi:hypothetical protein [Nocardioides sp.]|uniref:hypothetical protein n=1 Tax=Nocardioides sp. TaxID=35761 RepID=UPI002D143520|nr:hypothetical protein [Nocardioides sp.]HSX65938.1 hypothetical protein [Nocardioides sp.]
MSNEPERTGNVVKDFCVGLLVAAMALWGAIEIVKAIWVPLCIVVALAGIGALVWWRISARFRGW